MKTGLLLTLLTLFLSVQASATPPANIKNKKIELSYLELYDDIIRFAATDVHQMILRKSKGYLWPATKVLLFKTDDKLFFNITAIDNAWSNMLIDSETPHGYFVLGGRMFIVVTKDDSVNLDDYFILRDDIKKQNFTKSENTENTESGCPIWYYLHKGDMATVVNSVNMAKLGR
ncbi:hypothetical protein [Dysgonomonas sp. 511]|uniref:hypothetical protein n=1 Tax=Dysgonomonas sp. 511 TaxID=2302930 RepID=UPI0013D0550E|nr:hypothetical protein [Dysgonomonas sp. 511]